MYSVRLWIIPVLFGISFPGIIFAQDNSSPVQFHGTNITTGQYSSRQGFNSLMPRNYLRNELQMTLSLYDVPLSTRFYLTTENSDFRQKINNLSFYVDLNTLKRNKARIEAENKKNKKEDIRAPWRLRFLSKFSKIEGGRFRPNYSDLTLSRIPVSGLNLEFTDKVIYAAFAVGQTERSLNYNNNLRSLNQNLVFGKFGFGQKAKSHLYFTYMDVRDDAPAEPQPLGMIDSTGTNLKPRTNKIAGAEFRLSFFKQRWVVDGEAGASTYTRDNRLVQEHDSIFSGIPNFVLHIVEPNVSSSVDYAYGFGTKIKLPTTLVSGSYRWVGPGYYTLGNPNLINDRRTFEGKIDQVLFKRKLSLSAFYKKYNDNLLDTKDRTTNSDSYGIIAKLILRKFPYFQFSYIPNQFKTSVNNLDISNAINVFNASTGYNYSINKKIRSYSGFNYYSQKSEYIYETVSNYTSHNQTFALNQALTFNPIQVNLNLGITNVDHTLYKLNIKSLAFSGTHTLKGNWKNTLGMKLMNSNTENNSSSFSNRDEDKLSFYWQSQIKMWNNGSFKLSVQENIYKSEDALRNFNELVMLSTLIIKW